MAYRFLSARNARLTHGEDAAMATRHRRHRWEKQHTLCQIWQSQIYVPLQFNPLQSSLSLSSRSSVRPSIYSHQLARCFRQLTPAALLLFSLSSEPMWSPKALQSAVCMPMAAVSQVFLLSTAMVGRHGHWCSWVIYTDKTNRLCPSWLGNTIDRNRGYQRDL